MDLDYKIKFYGSSTVGERGQIVLPIEARKRFKIKPGDKLVVVSANSKDFEKIVLLKSESMAKMFSFLTEFEGQLKKSGSKGLEEVYQKGIGKIKEALKEGQKKRGKKRQEEAIKKRFNTR